MNAGKSNTLLQFAHNYRARGMKPILLIPQLDHRTGTSRISSNIGMSAIAATCHHYDDLFEYISVLHKDTNINYVLFDEAQFLTEAQVYQLSDVVDQLNITVLTYGICTALRAQTFTGSAALLRMADNLVEIKTISMQSYQRQYTNIITIGYKGTIMSIQIANRVAFLATGSEIVSGEIINTNSQQLAQILFSYGILAGDHLCVDDDQTNLNAGLSYLFSRHRVVITTGGLGPTADDRTRSCIAKLLNQPLRFDDACWQRIVKRITSHGKHLAYSNRQQAYFPQQAINIPNANGTADAFYLEHGQQLLIALPGPPKECLPIFNEIFLPLLCDLPKLRHNGQLYHWTVTGVPEATIAETLNESVALVFQHEIAYRTSTPYIYIKVFLTDDNPNRADIIAAIEAIVAPYLVKNTIKQS